MNRTLKNKDTFLSVFPAYGIKPDQKDSEMHKVYRYDEYHPIEQRKTALPDRTFYHKKDEIKRYTEEWLKTINMRGRK